MSALQSSLRPGARDVLRTMLKNARAAGSSEVQDLEARPDAVAGLHRSGPRPYRVLMYGGGVLEGRGLRDHNLGLPGRVADVLAARSGRGVDLDVVAAPDATAKAALQGLKGLRLRRYDAVVVMLGEHAAEARVPEAKWQMQFAALADLLLNETAKTTPIALWDSAHVSYPLGIDWRTRPVFEAATRLGAMTEQMCALTSRIHYRELSAPIRQPEFASRFSPATYEEWANDIVTPLYLRMVEVQGHVTPESPLSIRNLPDDERMRQRALESLRIEPGSDTLMEAVVRQAKLMFGVSHASINIIDDAVMWQKASTGAPAVLPRDQTACTHTIQQDGLVLINDTSQDPRLADSPLFTGPDALRFYAGFPIRTWDGYRIGTLCIADREPREMRPAELRPLRDFAGRVEQELWSAALRSGRRGRTRIRTRTRTRQPRGTSLISRLRPAD